MLFLPEEIEKTAYVSEISEAQTDPGATSAPKIARIEAAPENQGEKTERSSPDQAPASSEPAGQAGRPAHQREPYNLRARH